MSGSLALSRWNIVGHEAAVADLAAAVASERVAHAYLLTGPAGVGRTTLALALARTLNCEADPHERPCNACDTCRRIARGVHPDILLADMAWQEEMVPQERRNSSGPRRDFSIDAIRFLRQDIVTRPLQARWKIQIIADADKFSNHAPDAFLKTLEEPPPFAVIILIAGSVDDVLETILSRCRHVPLGAVATDDILRALLDDGVAEPLAGQLARAARGRVGWARAMAGDQKALAARREQLELALEQITTPLGRVSISGVIARDASKKRAALNTSLEYWTGLWRDAVLHHVGLTDRTAFPEVGDRLSSWASQHDLPALYRALWATQRCMSDLDSNVNTRIALHAMVQQWPD
jgi:DNA polymerase-3 subunit delta'